MTVRKCLLFASIAFVAVFAAFPAAAQNSTGTNHCVWKVTGAHNTVYLIGSIHLLKPTDYPLPAQFEQAYTNSQIVAFETDIGQLNSFETQMKILSKIMLPEGETLEHQLTPATWLAFSNEVDRLHLQMAPFTRITPVMAAMTLEVMEITKLGFDPMAGLDQHFFNRAKTDGKQIVPLETVDFQIHLITDFSRDESDLMMKSTIKEVEDTQGKFGELIQCWKNGDSKKLSGLLNDAMSDSPPIFKRLVTDRSASWIPKIQEFLSGTTNAVVIVGAGHLVGDEGVVDLLKKKGFKVTQL